MAQPESSYATVAAGAAAESNVNITNVAATQNPAARASVKTPRRTKAGFVAAAGLVVLSLLVLASGLALVRAFKQR